MDKTPAPSEMDKSRFLSVFGGVFEHSAWIAERCFDAHQAAMPQTAIALHAAMTRHFRAGTRTEKTAVLTAHPDLAGKLAQAKRLTVESTAEQASAGLNALTDEERHLFQTLNTAYVEKFEFPFIIAVRGLNKVDILNAFQSRINNDADEEFEAACAQVERIALLRIKDILKAE